MADERFLKEMGNRISEQRKTLRLTQEQLAEQMNVSVQMVSNLEQGKKAIRPENLVNLCFALNISADYILTGRKSTGDLSQFNEKLLRLSVDELKMIETFIDYCLNR